jgi:flagellar protein FliL
VNIFITPKSKPSQILYIGLLSLAGVLILLLIIGTIIGVARSSGSKPLFSLGKPAGTKAKTAALDDDIRVFSGLGRLRIPLSNSSTLILSIAFPYPAHDTAFTEELAAKIGEFKSLAADYFSALPADKIADLDEEAAKQEILARYNAILRLGRIRTIFFSDMMVID